MCEVCHPELIRAVCRELTVHQIQRALRAPQTQKFCFQTPRISRSSSFIRSRSSLVNPARRPRSISAEYDSPAFRVQQYDTFHDEGSGDSDDDWFRIFPEAGDSLNVETFSAGGRRECDTQIDVADSAMDLITSRRDTLDGPPDDRLPIDRNSGPGICFECRNIGPTDVRVKNDEKVSCLTRYLLRMYESRDSWAKQACHNSPLAALGSNELRILETLDGTERMNMGSLSEQTSLPLSTLTGLTDKLVSRGFLERTRSDRDRRVVEVGLTEFGARAFAHRKDAHQDTSRRILSALDAEEQKLLLQLLSKIVDR